MTPPHSSRRRADDRVGRRIVLAGLLVLAAVALLVVVLVEISREPSARAVPAASSTLATASSPPAPAPALADPVEQHLVLMAGEGKAAQASLDASLASLRDHREDAVRTAVALYERTPDDQYLRRWSLVDLLGALHSPAATAVVARIARAPLPARGELAFDEEAMIRMRAIDALRGLAEAGDAAAEEALRACVDACAPELKAAAVHAALELGGPALREALARSLPPAEHWMLDLHTGELADEGAIAAPAQPAHGDEAPRDIPVL